MGSEFAYIVDTLFVLFAFVLIILMVPGFAMLEAGLVRTKNVSDGFCWKNCKYHEWWC